MCISVQTFLADAATYTPELLHQLKPHGMPPHVLELNIGALIILLCYLNRSMSLMNGTRLVVKKSLAFNIRAEMVTSYGSGNIVLLPRIDSFA